MSDKDQRKVPLLRFKGFTNDWEQRKLKELAIFNPKDNLPEEFEYVDLESVIGTEMLSHKKTALSDAPSRAQRLAKKGDIFYQTVRPYQKNDYLFDKDAENYVFSTGYAQIRPKINGNFLFQLLRTERFVKKVLNECTGTSYPAINSKDLSNIKVSYTNYKEEQRSIGSLLDNLDNLVALQQQKNADIINLKKAILDKIFSNSNIQKWRDIRLNKVLSIPVDEPKEVTNIDDIISVKLNTQGISKIPNRSTLKLGSTKYYVRHGGQFIFGKQNFFNGSMAIIPSEYDGKVSSKDVPSLNINKDIVMPYFLWLYLSRPSFYKKTERWATGTGSKRLHIKDLLSLKIYIPNKNEQLRICKLMRSLDTQILKSQKHLKELQSIKKFLLQNMFI
ncbi:MAG: restriction endonuclease subunit S [Lactobacillus amylovorus]